MESQKSDYTFGKAFRYSIAMIPENAAYQTFSFLIFTFYFSVVGLSAPLVSAGFILWSVWNALNDPLMGFFSDRTKSRPKVGRRKIWVMIAFVPLAAVMIFLFTPPDTDPWTFIYFLLIICLFELVYTTFSLNQIAMFPEIFMKDEDRVKANNIRQIVSIIGLIVAFVLPTFVIGDLTDPLNRPKFVLVGGIAAGIIIVIVSLWLFIVPKEKKEFSRDYKTNPGFFKSLGFSLKNNAFLAYLPTNLATWYVFGILPSIIPYYGKFILGMDSPEEAFLLGVLLAVGFVTAAVTMPFWSWLSKKVGARVSWIIALITWIACLSPLMFISTPKMGFVVFSLMGFGMGGSLLNKDIIFGQIIDNDEVKTGVRREASYFGIDNFFSRLATVLVFVSIGSVFTSTGWIIYDPIPSQEIILGIKSLMFIFPAIALTIGIIFMFIYPLHGKKLSDMREQLERLHEQKKQDTRAI